MSVVSASMSVDATPNSRMLKVPMRRGAAAGGEVPGAGEAEGHAVHREEVRDFRHDFDHREERGRVTALEERVSTRTDHTPRQGRFLTS